MKNLLRDMKCLCDPTRLRILSLLKNRNALNSTKIAKLLDLKTSITSHHLKILENRNFVLSHKSGRHVLYRKNDINWERFLEKLDTLE